MSGRALPAIVAVGLAAAACAAPAATAQPSAPDLPAAFSSAEPYAPEIDPSDFVASVDNPYFPLSAGARWVYRGSGDAEGEIDTVEVLAESRKVMGVACTVVRDEVSRDGEPVEITEDWYAQDTAGNVWYFGEATTEYRDGEPAGTAGSWEAGVDGAQPGIIMAADPAVGMVYRQEFYAGEAEDVAKVIELGASADVPFGSWDEVVITEDWTSLEPDLREHKHYAPGIGLVLEQTIEGGDERFELVEHTP